MFRGVLPSGASLVNNQWRMSVTRQSLFRYTTQAEKPLFDKILIANRGEIACRVIKTAKKLGVRTVSVFSDADRNALHVQLADEAFYIGKPPAKESYLLGDKIIEVAKKTKAQAIHPGYGFLSENAEFAEKCKENGIVFIGPPPSAIRDMGSKSASKHIMQKANVPVVPGYHEDNQDLDTLQKAAEQIGYPVLIKAWMGGGGKGMRIVFKPEDFESSLESARRESMSSFGDDRVLVEKYLVRPRHIEVQVFGDQLGNYVYLFERDCSVQRRHQKVVEEAPAPGMSEEKRAEMGTAAVNAAKAVGYVGAGTVEFIVDEDTGAFYFMEMNTRLQVEHPVSEMISRQDLVEWQLQAASGNRLPKLQDELKIHGHALEARIYAENPDSDFLPGTGKLSFVRTPEENENVRIDTGVRAGDQVSVYYDPMIAKLIVWEKDRATAIRKMYEALDQYKIVGLTTNVPFLKRVITHQAFRDGHIDTRFISLYKDDLLSTSTATQPLSLALAAIYSALTYQHSATSTQKSGEKYSPWTAIGARRFNHDFDHTFAYSVNEKLVNVSITTNGKTNAYNVKVGDNTFVIQDGKLTGENDIVATVDGNIVRATVVPEKQSLFVFYNDQVVELVVPAPSYTKSSGSSGSLVSPMPGRIIKVNVAEGEHVKQGQCLIIMEAMKMEHQIKATSDGVVSNVFYKVGDIVEAKKPLIAIQPEGEEAKK